MGWKIDEDCLFMNLRIETAGISSEESTVTDNPLVLKYIQDLNAPLGESAWESVYQKAVEKNIPVVRKTTVRLLYLLAVLHRPLNALEIGTGSGYSALWIRKGLPEQSKLTTLERDNNRYQDAALLFRDYPGIELIKADAFQFLKESPGGFDFVFLDSQKRDYIDFLPLLKTRIVKGGLLIIDNFLFNGKVVEIDPKDEAKYRGGVELLKRFNHSLSSDGSFESLFLPLDDGLAVARKLD